MKKYKTRVTSLLNCFVKKNIKKLQTKIIAYFKKYSSTGKKSLKTSKNLK